MQNGKVLRQGRLLQQWNENKAFYPKSRLGYIMYRRCFDGFPPLSILSLGADYPPTSAYYAWSVLNSNLQLRVQQNLITATVTIILGCSPIRRDKLTRTVRVYMKTRLERIRITITILAPKNWHELCDRIS
jgi:hypothetical protein